ncbi:MAG: NAD(P)-dependent oxidoreductase [Loktanella sp.]|nr:NAD(P)-dependent oxidoreductase [Loktanella sp.]
MSFDPDRGLAVVGLGKMGLPMARVLQAAGADPLCFDIDASARDTAEKDGLRICTSLAEAFQNSGIVLLSLPNAEIVEATVSAGLAGRDSDQAPIVVDASTSTAEISRKMAAVLDALGGAFLDAPVSGGPAGAANGTLTFMVGGPAATVETCRPVFETLGKKTLHAGEVGAGNIAKIANNMMVASHFLVARECLALAQSAGLEAGAALEVVNAATGGSTVTQVHFPTWVMTRSFDSGFTMGLMRKDVGLALSLAEETGLEIPLSRLVADHWTGPGAPADGADFTEMGDPETLLEAAGKKEARST